MVMVALTAAAFGSVACGGKSQVNLTEVPEASLVEPGDHAAWLAPAPASDELPAAPARHVVADGFDSADPRTWLAFTDKAPVNDPSIITVADGKLQLTPRFGGDNPFLFTKTFRAPPQALVRVRRRVQVTPGGGTFASYLALVQTPQAPTPPWRISAPYAETNALALVYYLDMDRPGGFLQVQQGVVVSNGSVEAPQNYKITEPQFGAWLDEELLYDQSTGMVYHRLGQSRTMIGGSLPVWPYLSVAMANLGGSPEGAVQVDWLYVDFPDASVLDPWLSGSNGVDSAAGAAPADLPPGGSQTAWTGLAALSTDASSTVSAPGMELRLPPLPGGELPVSIATLSPTAPAGVNIKAAASVTLGSEHRFAEPLALRFAEIPAVQPPAEGGFAVYPYAGLSWQAANQRWVPEPTILRDGRIELRTTHLSSFAIIENGPFSTMTYTPGDTVPDLAAAKEAYWQAFKSSVSDTGNLGSMTTLLSDFPFLGELDGAVGSLASTTMILGIANDIRNGNTSQAKMDIIKAASGWPLGAIGTWGARIAGLGVFFIDSSLQAFAQGVREARRDVLINAYLGYYEKANWTATVWLDKILELLRRPGNDEDHRQDLLQLITDYKNLIWTDEGGFVENISEHQQGAFGYDAGMSDELKLEMEDRLMERSWPTIKVAVDRAFEVLETEAVRRRLDIEYKAREMLEGHVQYWITARGKYLAKEVVAVFMRDGAPVFRGRPVDARADFAASVPVRQLPATAPDEVVLYVRMTDKDKLAEYARATIPYGGSMNGSVQVIDIAFDIEAKAAVEEKQPEPEPEKKEQPAPVSSTKRDLVTALKTLETTRDYETARAALEKLIPNLKKETSDSAIRWLVEKAEDWGYLAIQDPELKARGLLYMKLAPSDDPLGSHGGMSNYRLIGLSRPADLPQRKPTEPTMAPQFHGPVSEIYPDSSVQKVEAFYLYGLPWGPYKDWHDNGQLKSTGEYKAGMPIGAWSYYYADSSLEASGTYDDDGKKHGGWIETRAKYGVRSPRQFRMEYSHGAVTNDSDLQAVMKEAQEAAAGGRP